MNTIWKHPLKLTDTQELMFPEGYIVHVGEQHGIITLWVLVDPETKQRPYKIHILGTGRQIPDNLMHIGTVITAGGALVWHVFEDMGGGLE